MHTKGTLKNNFVTAPGLVDMHVHFREPGFEYKEDIQSGAAAAAAGGFTTVCCMPNTRPVADCEEVIAYVKEKAEHVKINVLPIGAVTIGQKGRLLTDFAALKKAGVVALSDDGMPINDDGIMRRALELAEENNLLIISHCEEEAPMAERDVKLCAEIGARVHIAHVSLAATVDIIRRAKEAGVSVTAETCPHYFSLTEDEVKRQGAVACMNPPLRKKSDVEAIIRGLQDGTIDVIATDHAPHSREEKSLPAGEAPNGIVGLETSLAVSLTFLYHTGKLSIDQIIKLMSENPSKILGLPLQIGDSVVFDPDEEWVVDESRFLSKARSSPFSGMKLCGTVKNVGLSEI